MSVPQNIIDEMQRIGVRPPQPSGLSTIDQLAEEEGLAPRHRQEIAAIGGQESGRVTNEARPDSHASGGLQVIPSTGLHYVTPGEWATPQGKIRAGLRYYKSILNAFPGDDQFDQRAAAYHAGIGAVQHAVASGQRLPHTEDRYVSRQLGRPYFTDTDYVPTVLARFNGSNGNSKPPQNVQDEIARISGAPLSGSAHEGQQPQATPPPIATEIARINQSSTSAQAGLQTQPTPSTEANQVTGQPSPFTVPTYTTRKRRATDEGEPEQGTLEPNQVTFTPSQAVIATPGTTLPTRAAQGQPTSQPVASTASPITTQLTPEQGYVVGTALGEAADRQRHETFDQAAFEQWRRRNRIPVPKTDEERRNTQTLFANVQNSDPDAVATLNKYQADLRRRDRIQRRNEPIRRQSQAGSANGGEPNLGEVTDADFVKYLGTLPGESAGWSRPQLIQAAFTVARRKQAGEAQSVPALADMERAALREHAGLPASPQTNNRPRSPLAVPPRPSIDFRRPNRPFEFTARGEEAARVQASGQQIRAALQLNSVRDQVRQQMSHEWEYDPRNHNAMPLDDGAIERRINQMREATQHEEELRASLSPEQHQQAQEIAQGLQRRFSNEPGWLSALDTGLDISASNTATLIPGVWRIIGDVTGSQRIKQLAREGEQYFAMRREAHDISTRGQTDTQSVLTNGARVVSDVVQLAALSEVAGPVKAMAALGGLESLGGGQSYGRAAMETVKGAGYGAMFGAAARIRPFASTEGLLARGGDLAAHLGTVATGTYAIERAFGSSHQEAMRAAMTNTILSGVLQFTGTVGAGVSEEARMASEGRGAVGERLPENVRAAITRARGRVPVYVQEESGGEGGRIGVVNAEPGENGSGRIEHFRPLTYEEVGQVNPSRYVTVSPEEFDAMVETFDSSRGEQILNQTPDLEPAQGSMPQEPGATALVRREGASPNEAPTPNQAPSAPQPTPETPETINAQMEAFVAGRRKAILVTPGEEMPPYPRDLAATETSVGTFIHNPREITPAQIKSMVNDGSYGSLLGHVEPPSQSTTQVVTARHPETGAEIQSSYVSPDNVPEQTARYEEMYPRAHIEHGGAELERQVLSERQQVSTVPARESGRELLGTNEQINRELQSLSDEGLPLSSEIRGLQSSLSRGATPEIQKIIENNISQKQSRLGEIQARQAYLRAELQLRAEGQPTDNLPDLSEGAINATDISSEHAPEASAAQDRQEVHPAGQGEEVQPSDAGTEGVSSQPPGRITPKQIVRHSDPNIDGGEVVGRTPDGRLKVRNNEGGISIVQDPRKQGGNREAALTTRHGLVIKPKSESLSESQGQKQAQEVIAIPPAAGTTSAVAPENIEETSPALQKAVKHITRKPRRRRQADETRHSLAEFVMLSGGIRPDRDNANAGELKRLSTKSLGGRWIGLVNKNSSHTAEQMATHAAELGYPVTEGGGYAVRGREYASNVDPNFLSMAEDDARGIRKIYSSANEAFTEADLEELTPEQKEDLDTELRFLADAHVVRLLKEVENGNEDEGIREELSILASNYGLPDEAVDANLSYARDAWLEREGLLEASFEQGEEDTSFAFGSNREPTETTTPRKLTAPEPEQSDAFARLRNLAADSWKLTKSDYIAQDWKIRSEEFPGSDSFIARKNAGERHEQQVKQAAREGLYEQAISRGELTSQEALNALESLGANPPQFIQKAIKAIADLTESPLKMARPEMREATPEERKALKIPPAWTDVHITDDPNARLLAVGRDGKGRTQRLYSAAHTEAQLVAKFIRQREFNSALPAIMEQVERDAEGGNEEASVLRLIALTGFRVGSEADTGAKIKAYGATTLRAEHVKIEGDVVHFDFIGKLGVRQQHSIRDSQLAQDLQGRMTRGGALFSTNDTKVRNYLNQIAGGKFYKVHDFRTWNATEAARKAIEDIQPPTNAEEYWQKRDDVGDIAARKIGDTRQIALDTYIDPLVFEDWRERAGVEENATRPRQTRRKTSDIQREDGTDERTFRDQPLRRGVEEGRAARGSGEEVSGALVKSEDYSEAVKNFSLQASSQSGRIESVKEYQPGARLPSEYVYHQTTPEALEAIEREGFSAGAFTDRPFDFHFTGVRPVWVAIKKSELPNVQSHQYGSVIAHETSFEAWPEYGRAETPPIPPENIYLVDRRGRVIRRLGASKQLIERGVDASLKMAQQNQALRSVENSAELAASASTSLTALEDNEVVGNPEAAELIRRVIDKSSADIDGLTLLPEESAEVIRDLREAATHMKSLGWDEEDIKPLRDFIGNLMRARRATPSKIVVFKQDVAHATEHEYMHEGQYVGSGMKHYSEHLSAEDFADLGKTNDIKAYDDYFKNTPSERNVPVERKVTELVAFYAAGDYQKFGRTFEQAREFLKKYFRAYIKQNGRESVEAFRKQHTYVRQIIEEEKARAENPSAEERPVSGSLQDLQGEREPARGSPEPPDGRAPSTPRDEATSETLKPRSLPSTLRERGIAAADSLYEIYPNRAAIADAKSLLEKLGWEASVSLIKSGQALGAEHMALAKILSRTLLSQASEISSTDETEAARLRSEALSITSTISAAATKAGQFNQAVQAIETSVEDVMAAAQRIVSERGRELSPPEAARIHRAGEELERTNAEMEVAASGSADARAQIEENRKMRGWAEGGQLTMAEIDTLRKRLANLRAKEKTRERRIDELEGRIPPHVRKVSARKGGRSQVRQRAAESLAFDELDLMAQVKSALGMGGHLKMAQARALTDTEAFKRWFGDSKVVDEEGKPLVLYHGTRGDFDEFSGERRIYLTTNPEQAALYGNTMMPVYLKAGSIREVGETAGRWWKDKFDAVTSAYKQLDSRRVDVVLLRNTADPPVFNKGEKQIFGDIYVVNDPTQIKSATGNRGTFSLDDPNILKMAQPAERLSEGFTGETLQNLAHLGALRILRGQSSVEEWKQGMISDFGSQIKPQIDSLHAESVKVVRETLRQARRDAELERIRSRPGNEELSQGELEEIADEERNAKRRAQLARTEHERAAKAYESGQRKVERETTRKEARTVSSVELRSKALAEAIGRSASSDIDTIAAAKLAQPNMTPERFNAEMSREHNLKSNALRDAFTEGARVLESARNEIKESKRLAEALRQAEKSGEADLNLAMMRLHEARAQKRDAERKVARELAKLKQSKFTPTLAALLALARDGLLSAKGLLRIASGMSVKQAGDLLASFGESAIDTTASKALGLPRTTASPSLSAIINTLISLPRAGGRRVKATMQGKSSDLMPAHDPPTENPYVNVAATMMQRLYASKEVLLRSFAHPLAKNARARVFALNDFRGGGIKRSEIGQRTNEYVNGTQQFSGSNIEVARDLAKQQAEYEARSGAISPSVVETRTRVLATHPADLIDALAMQDTEKQVYANPSLLSEGMQGARSGISRRNPVGGKVFDIASTIVLPFVKRPANSITDALYTYTGVRIPVEAAKIINEKWTQGRVGADQRRAFNRAVARGAIGWALFGLGALLAAYGLMTPVSDDRFDPTSGAIHVGGRYWKVANIPFVGWLLGMGATYQMKGAHAVPKALLNMILEHPLLRGISDMADAFDEAKQAVQGGVSASKLEMGAGHIGARLIPSPLAIIAEGMDTRERKQVNPSDPFLYRIPGARQTLEPRTDGQGNEIQKSHLSVVDPFSSVSDENVKPLSPAMELLREIQRARDPNPTPATETERLHRDAINKLAGELKEGQDVREDFKQLIRQGVLKAGDFRQIRERAALTDLQRGIEDLSLEEAERVYSEVTPEERAQLEPILKRKRKRALAEERRASRRSLKMLTPQSVQRRAMQVQR